MKNKFIKVILAGILSVAVLIPCNEVFAMNIDSNSAKLIMAQKDGLQDGRYNVSFQTLKEKSEELSMAGQYIDSNAVLEVRGDKMYLMVKVLRADWMQNIKVLINDSIVNHENIAQDDEGKIAKIKFEIPNKKPNIKFKMNVVPMGNADVAFRVVLNDDITKIASANSNNNSKDSDVASKVSNGNVKNNNANVKDGDENTESSDDKELPQTGFPILNQNLFLMGGISTLLGVVFFRKRK